MPERFRKIRIFIASPGDVAAERDQLGRVVDELNITIPAIAPEKKVVLELVRWETHIHPAIDVRQVRSNIDEVKARGGCIIAVISDDDTELESLVDHVIRIPRTHDA
jgi:hypothetical protein